MINARNNKPYDFKVTNGTDKPIKGIKPYRGMPIGISKDGYTVFASGRDVGNIAAGYVAAANDMGLFESLGAFNAYQSYSDIKLSIEGRSTTRAEILGWIIGFRNTNALERKYNLSRSLVHPISSIVNYIHNHIKE